jgi:hypothetical protein
VTSKNKIALSALCFVIFVITAWQLGHNHKSYTTHDLIVLGQATGLILCINSAITAPDKWLRLAYGIMCLLLNAELIQDIGDGNKVMQASDFINPVFAVIVFSFLFYKDFIAKRKINK